MRRLGYGVGARKGSLLYKLKDLEVGERIYLECQADEYEKIMRRITASSRYPRDMMGNRYTCTLYRALGPTLLDIRVLVAVDRLAPLEDE